jgi:membrane-bound inhibitor of C-type lysozyme
MSPFDCSHKGCRYFVGDTTFWSRGLHCSLRERDTCSYQSSKEFIRDQALLQQSTEAG